MRATVSQLNNYIKQVFDSEEMLHNIEVIGEIDGMSIRGSAVNFSLKDEAAVIPCVCWTAARMKGIQNGSSVIVRGTVSYWHKAGKISFVVTSCEQFGLGALFLKFEELKKKLEAEGLFAAKKPMPSVIKRVGVVTSKSGAVLHDIIKIAHRRNPNVDIVLYDTAVQGVDAEHQICKAIDNLGAGVGCVDVIIVARGGGSKDDLSAFNCECVARSVFASKVPVVSAVGHETDWTLIDLVADLRAATPSAAAEIVVREVVTDREAAIRAYRYLRFTLMTKIEKMFGRVENAWTGIKNSVNFKINEREGRLQNLAGIIEANNPLAVLRRGYAKVYKDGQQIGDAGDAEVGDKLDIKLYNGTIGAEVLWTKKSAK